MTQTVTVNIDGAFIRVAKGRSILDAAMQYGICIPHLCHVPNLSNIGSCRLCIVEHIENGRSKITTSCTLMVKEGMRILTSTDEIRRLRRNLAELLVAEAPNSRAVQDMAVLCGVKEVRFPFKNNDCILCGRCVKICTGRHSVKAIGFVGRGKERKVQHPFGIKSNLCRECGACVDLCPMSKTPCDGPMLKGKERLCMKCETRMASREKHLSLCVSCNLGEGLQCERYLPVNL
jgi:bidirectional [NiFe] hydrogenase diaphorase subunit